MSVGANVLALALLLAPALSPLPRGARGARLRFPSLGAPLPGGRTGLN